MVDNVSSSTSKKATILIVDDVPKNIQVLGAVLSNSGYSIIAAINGNQALDAVAKELPDLILLDVVMPEMDGYETCKCFKESTRTRHIPIIFLTAKTEAQDIVKGFEAGAVDYILKPFNSVELLARVRTHLELKFGRETIVQKNNEQKELLHVLCHDLANPIGGLQSIFELIDEDESHFKVMQKYMKIAISNSMSMIDLVREMQALDENKVDLAMTVYCLKHLIEEAVLILQQMLFQKEISVDIDVDPEIQVKVEKISFINSVLNNILSNAIKFSFERSKIRISTAKQNDQIILSIRDYGIGMSDGLLENLFDISKKTSRQGTLNEPGTGFGMPMIKKYVEVYGGSVKVTSTEKTEESVDHGTEIMLTLVSSR